MGVFSGWVVVHGITKIHVWINSRRFSRQQTSQVIPVWFGVLSLPIYAWVVSTYLTSNNIFLSSIYFGIKVKIIQHAKHITKIFKPCCGVSVDRLGSLFKCYYKNQIVYLSMKGYINKALTKYQQPNPTQSHHSPFKNSTIQYVKGTNNSGGQLTTPLQGAHQSFKRYGGNTIVLWNVIDSNLVYISQHHHCIPVKWHRGVWASISPDTGLRRNSTSCCYLICFHWYMILKMHTYASYT